MNDEVALEALVRGPSLLLQSLAWEWILNFTLNQSQAPHKKIASLIQAGKLWRVEVCEGQISHTACETFEQGPL